MATPNKTGVLIPPKSPNLLVAPSEYSQQYQDQLNNALRLYFAQVDNFAQPIASSGSPTAASALVLTWLGIS